MADLGTHQRSRLAIDVLLVDVSLEVVRALVHVGSLVSVLNVLGFQENFALLV